MNGTIREKRLHITNEVQLRYNLNRLLYDKFAQKNEPVIQSNHTGAVNSLSVEGVESRYLLSGGGDATIRLWDLDETTVSDTGEKQLRQVAEIPRKLGHQFGVSCVQWWPADNGMFVSSSFDSTVKVWDPNEMTEVYSFDLAHKVYNIDVSRTGQHSLVATAADHPFIKLIDLRTTSASHILTGHNGKVLSVKWSPTTSHILASGGSDGSCRIWDIRRSNACLTSLDMQQAGDAPTRTPLDERRAHRSSVNGLCWFPGGDYLLSSGNDEKIRLWSLHPVGGKNMLVNFGPLIRNRHIQTLDPCLSPRTHSPWPYLFFPSDNGEILMFRAVDGKLVKRLTRGSVNSARTACMVPRGDGSQFEYISGALDGSITLWGAQWFGGKLGRVRAEDESDEEPTVLDKIWKEINA
ncbi:hypothetical protein TRVA0_078S00298 [Trichomonascus vanleenenianus]|uniref:Rad28p n=1 Tax=Trichomonascus vanleenenianus TaxID=2268995 RepID=UPI003ECA24D7